MAVNGFISPERVREAEQRPIQVVARHKDKMLQAAAVVENILTGAQSPQLRPQR